MKKILFLAAAMIISIASKAQTLYELKYYDIETEMDYIGLFYFTSEDEGLLRCVAADPKLKKEGEIWETDYVSSYEKNKDGNFICFFPYEAKTENGDIFPSFLLGYDKNGRPTENWVIFQDLMGDEDIDEDKAFECEYFREVSITEKDENYFKQFYDDGEEILEEIMNARKLLINQSEHNTPVIVSEGSTPTMHLLMVAATYDENIGESVETDLKLVKKNFSEYAKQLGIPYNEVIIEGSQYTKSNVKKAINKIKSKPEDIIVFVYSGHGFRFLDDTDPFPRMFVSVDGNDDVEEDTQMSTSEVFKMISDKNARLTIFLTDCCNSNIDAYKSSVESMSFGTRSTQNNTDINKLKSLFIDQNGVIRITAAKAGQYALCDRSGGYLLTSFINNIRAQVSAIKNETPSWNKIADNAGKAVEKKSSSQVDEAGNPEDPQIIVKSIRLKSAPLKDTSHESMENNSASVDSNNEEGETEMSDTEAIIWTILITAIPLLIIYLIIGKIIKKIRKKD